MIKTVLSGIMVFLSFGLPAADVWAQEAIADIELNHDNYNVWLEHILPHAEELEFLKIPWERTFQDGILKANEVDKPVLLWTMNGHPLGCT